MQFLIPEIGDKFTLAEDWTFILYNEYRNATARELFKPAAGNQPRTHEETMTVLESWARAEVNHHKKWVARLKFDYDRAVKDPVRTFGRFVQTGSWGYSGEYKLDLDQDRIDQVVEHKRKLWQDAVDATKTAAEIVEELKSDRERGYDYLKEGKDRPTGGQVTLPRESELVVDRIYIRKGAKEYSSITFRLNSLGDVPLKQVQHFGKKVSSVRFWAKLSDVNEIQIETYDKVS